MYVCLHVHAHSFVYAHSTHTFPSAANHVHVQLHVFSLFIDVRQVFLVDEGLVKTKCCRVNPQRSSTVPHLSKNITLCRGLRQARSCSRQKRTVRTCVNSCLFILNCSQTAEVSKPADELQRCPSQVKCSSRTHTYTEGSSRCLRIWNAAKIIIQINSPYSLLFHLPPTCHFKTLDYLETSSHCRAVAETGTGPHNRFHFLLHV